MKLIDARSFSEELASERVPKVVKAKVRQLGALDDSLKRFLDVG